MKRKTKRIISLLLVLLMVFGSFPVTARVEAATTGSIELEIYDLYDDGWNGGASITVSADGEEVGTYSYTEDYAYTWGRTFEISYDPFKCYTFSWNKGTCDEECSFIISLNGEDVYVCMNSEEYVGYYNNAIEYAVADSDNIVTYEVLADGEVFFTIAACKHETVDEDAVCSNCGRTCGVGFAHNIVNGACTRCGATAYSVSCEGSNVTFGGLASATGNTEYIAELSANAGYTLSAEDISITVGGNEISDYTYTDGKLTIPAANVTGDIEIVATAQVIPVHTITMETCINGSVTVEASAYEGKTVTLTVTPDTGYLLNTLIVKDSSDTEVTVTGNTFVMPGSAVTVTATFVKNHGDFTVTGDESGWSVADGVLTFSKGGEYTLAMASGKTSTDDIIVVSAEGVTLTLNDIIIAAPEGDETDGKNALEALYETKLVLTGSNKLSGGKGGSYTQYAGPEIGCNGGAGIKGNVIIAGSGSLSVSGGNGYDSSYASGGNGGDGITGSVKISGGTVTSTGGTGGTTIDDEYYEKGTDGKAFGSVNTSGDDVTLIIEAGESADDAAVVTEYNSEKYAKLTVCQHSDEDGDGKCDSCASYMDGIGASLAGYTLSLSGNIGINFYMELSDEILNDTAAYMQFTLGGVNYGTVAVSDAETDTIDDKTYYVFQCGVPAKNMETTITAQIVLGDETTGTKYSYTVKDYADYILDAENGYDKDTKTLVEAMLSYGEYAEAYFNKEECEATQEMNEIDKDTLSGYAYKVSGSLPDGVAYYGSSLLLKSETTIRHYFTATDASVLPDGYTEKNGMYYYEVTGIVVVDLCNSKTTTIGEWSISYSAFSYAYSVLASDTTSTSLQNLVKALYLYYEATGCA